MGKSTTKSYKIVRWIFFLIYPLLGFHLYCFFFFPPPFPSFLLPYFGGIHGSSDTVVLQMAEFRAVCKDTTLAVSKDQIFYDLPIPYRVYLTQNIFGKEKAEVRENPELKKFIGDRLDSVEGLENVQYLEIDWLTCSYDIAKNPVTQTVQLDTTIIFHVK